MKKPTAIAAAAPQPGAFTLALKSAADCSKLLANLMYGTEKRTQITLLSTAGLIAMGYCLQMMNGTLLPVCIN